MIALQLMLRSTKVEFCHGSPAGYLIQLPLLTHLGVGRPTLEWGNPRLSGESPRKGNSQDLPLPWGKSEGKKGQGGRDSKFLTSGVRQPEPEERRQQL